MNALLDVGVDDKGRRSRGDLSNIVQLHTPASKKWRRKFLNPLAKILI
jgi:hypothetical protein